MSDEWKTALELLSPALVVIGFAYNRSHGGGADQQKLTDNCEDTKALLLSVAALQRNGERQLEINDQQKTWNGEKARKVEDLQSRVGRLEGAQDAMGRREDSRHHNER